MKIRNGKSVALTLLMALATIAQAAEIHEPALSAAQTAVVSRSITMLKSSTDRHVAESWSNSKKVAEMICRPAALPVLKKQAKGVDRVFLGTDDPASLTLESNRRLTGSGEFRTPHGWKDFTFTCNIDPQTAKVISFHPVLLNASH
jgi:hypothetical protein